MGRDVPLGAEIYRQTFQAVPMGTHKVSEFTGKNSYTAFTDFSIALSNCSAFLGYYQGTSLRAISDGSINNFESRKINVLQVRLDPTRTAITP